MTAVKEANLDAVPELDIILHTGGVFSIVLAPKSGALDLVNARIHVSIKNRKTLIKTYAIGSGLEVFEVSKLRWSGSADDLKGNTEVSFDAYLTNTLNKRRSFFGTIKVNEAYPYGA